MSISNDKLVEKKHRNRRLKTRRGGKVSENVERLKYESGNISDASTASNKSLNEKLLLESSNLEEPLYLSPKKLEPTSLFETNHFEVTPITVETALLHSDVGDINSSVHFPTSTSKLDMSNYTNMPEITIIEKVFISDIDNKEKLSENSLTEVDKTLLYDTILTMEDIEQSKFDEKVVEDCVDDVYETKRI